MEPEEDMEASRASDVAVPVAIVSYLEGLCIQEKIDGLVLLASHTKV